MSGVGEILRRFLRPPRDAGERGERLAEAFLRREAGFRIVARNWRNPRDRRDEIDLVAEDGPVLVFVEVKAREAGVLVSGYHAVNARKRRVQRRAIQAYLAGLRVKPGSIRFDVVEVELGPEPKVRHFANLPLFGRYFRT